MFSKLNHYRYIMGILYIIATPIGNREDISIRAINMLGSVDVLLCEDTRRTGQLLNYIANEMTNDKAQISKQIQILNFKKPKLLSYHEHNEEQRIAEAVEMLKEEKDVGLVSDAGTPLISDPGFKLVRECLRQDIKVVSIPGPCSPIAALTSSGLPTDKFLFLGYLPKKEGKRRKIINEVNKLSHFHSDSEGTRDREDSEIKSTIIFLETPQRLAKSLNTLKEVLGDIEIVVARELTKLHEEVYQGKISEALEHFQVIKGEVVILFILH